jgi:N-terminal region of glycosyl transferase group 7
MPNRYIMSDILELTTVPKIVFIVPYRNRPQHKFFFSNYLTSILKNVDEYEIYFSHQCDARSFNRGATKNIGFMAIKEKYPNDYQNITFVFNDIDTIPFSNIFDYQTTHGIVKHFYGFKYALGGIVALTGSDFEATNGYPNFWGWGMEDNVLQKRCESIGLQIDRSNFYPIGSPDILQLFDGVSRLINKKDPWRATHDNGIDGIKTIHKLSFNINSKSKNPIDNIHTVISDKIFIINIDTFMTGTRYEHDNYFQYDLREPPRKIINPNKINTTKISATFDDWTNIPFYPTSEKKKEMIQEYGKQKAEEIIEYSYENSVDPTIPVIPPQQQQEQQQLHHNQQPGSQSQNLFKIQQYNQLMQQINSQTRIIPQNINKFSPAYSRIIAAKPKASASANIRLGGVY